TDLREDLTRTLTRESCRVSRHLSELVETLVAFSFCSAHHCTAMTAARARINLALKVLRSRHDPKQHVSASDVHTLKSCVRGDVTGRSVYEMATAVIRAELDREQHETARAKRA